MKYDSEAVLRWIIKYKREHDGNSPTVRELQKGCEISSTSVVKYILNHLEDRGKIVQTDDGDRYKSRCIEVVGGVWMC